MSNIWQFGFLEPAHTSLLEDEAGSAEIECFGVAVNIFGANAQTLECTEGPQGLNSPVRSTDVENFVGPLVREVAERIVSVLHLQELIQIPEAFVRIDESHWSVLAQVSSGLVLEERHLLDFIVSVAVQGRHFRVAAAVRHNVHGHTIFSDAQVSSDRSLHVAHEDAIVQLGSTEAGGPQSDELLDIPDEVTYVPEWDVQIHIKCLRAIDSPVPSASKPSAIQKRCFVAGAEGLHVVLISYNRVPCERAAIVRVPEGDRDEDLTLR